MKALKFDQDLADLIVQGKKTSTWRLYDDKDLSVNDEVKIVSKVVANRPETWKVIGNARINEIIQKKLSQIEPSDYDGTYEFPSRETMLNTFRKYYGKNVDFDTVVKIIRFTFDNNSSKPESEVVEATTQLTEAKLFADGGSRGNPGPSASGFAVLDMHDNTVVKKGVYLGITTNNQAEYQALKLGLEEALRMRVRNIHIYMDSLLVINQMRGSFKVRNRDLWPIHTAIKKLATNFEQVTYNHVPRALNKIADAAVNEALDQAAKN